MTPNNDKYEDKATAMEWHSFRKQEHIYLYRKIFAASRVDHRHNLVNHIAWYFLFTKNEFARYGCKRNLLGWDEETATHLECP